MPPKTGETYTWVYHGSSRAVLGYEIDVPEDARHLVRVERKKTGTYERGVESVSIRNDASVPTSITYYEFEK